MRPVNPDERPLGQPLIAGEPVVVKPREKSAFELAAERPVRGLSRGAPPPVPNLLASVAAGAVSFRASSFAEKCAAEIGLLDVLRELQAKAAQRYAIDPRALSAVRGRSFQITARTPLGFVHAPGDISWPPNQSLGRNLGLYMARTLTLKPGRSPAVIKVKGAGQAFDHPGEQRQQINQRSRPPLPYPLLWDRAYHKTGTVQFGLQRELAEHELKQILVVHALSKRVFGHLANVPTPLDVVPVEHVEIGGKKVSLVRARSDRSLWGGHEEYFDRDLQDVHQRLSEIHHPLLSEGPVSPQQLAQAFTESFPLAQLVLLERGQYRNNIGAVIRDPHVAEDSSRVLDEVLTQMLWAQGIAYDPPRGVDRSSYYEYHRAAAAPYQAHLTKALFHEARVMGRLYGMIRAFGADTKDGFHPKDSVGSEVTIGRTTTCLSPTRARTSTSGP